MDEIEGLKTLERPDASIPDTRFNNATSVQSKVRRLIYADQSRAWKRTQLIGLVDGNPPYRQSKLKAVGRQDVANVNWMSASSILEEACGIFWDLFSESTTNFNVRTGFGTQDQQEEWSRRITLGAHEILNNDPRWQYVFLTSQRNMVLFGSGPVYFETPSSVMPRSINTGQLLVDENAESETAYWELAVILMQYKCHELVDFIHDPVAAQKVGWRVKYTRNVIMNAVPVKQTANAMQDWEYYQRLFKQNGSTAYDDAAVIKCAHVFWREFDGTITHAIVEQQTTATPTDKSPVLTEEEKNQATQYLYYRKERYKHWSEIVHPLYYGRGDGTHYTTNGIGVPMYGALNFENKLRCNLADKAMSPKLLFKPMSESHPEFSLVQLGDYGKIPAGWDFQQTGMAGLMNDGLAMLNELGRTVSNNLAQYRQGWNRSQGNPPTAQQVSIESQQQYKMANTTIARYYRQLDMLFEEIVTRLCDSKNPDQLAVEFRKRMKEEGVPKEALGNIVKIEANRVAGQGSAVLRQQALDKLLGAVGRFPEDGQDNLWMDWIAAYTGQRGVERYYPQRKKDLLGTEQQAEATLQVAAMKLSIPPVVTPQQDPVVFASTFLKAATQIFQTVQQGGNPMQVIQFCDLAIPAAITHLQRLAQDPQRQSVAKVLAGTVKQLTTAVDKLKQEVAQKMQEQQQAQPRNGQPQLPPADAQKLAIEREKGKLKLQNMFMSHRQRMQQRAEQHQMQMATQLRKAQVDTAAKDLEVAGNIRRQGLKSLSE